MSLDLYRRHAEDCRFFDKGQNFTKCSCVIWAYGTLAGRPYRKSVKTRDWSLAVVRVERLEKNPQSIPIRTISEACALYLKDCAGRALAGESIKSRKTLLDHFVKFFSGRGLTDMSQISLEDLQAFRDSRQIKSNTKKKEVEYVKFLFAFCMKHKWIESNVARDLKGPQRDECVTLPYEREEIKLLLEACNKIDNSNRTGIPRARLRAKALVLLMLYSGMRVSDCVQVKRERLKPDGRLYIRTMKSGVDLYVRLHEDCLEALNALPVESPYFLWSGKSKIRTATGSARRTVTAVSKMAGVPARPHRFRDTFAVELLLNGEELLTVQRLLGHTSIKTTERHYAPYVARFQEILDRATAKLNFR
jgi:site-specific recombinase XerD